jgi:hypothetical protein
MNIIKMWIYERKKSLFVNLIFVALLFNRRLLEGEGTYIRITHYTPGMPFPAWVKRRHTPPK